MASNLIRPAAHLLERFHPGQVGKDRIEDYFTNGWSLAICCTACPRMVEWTPPELARRFGDRTDLRIADLVMRLACVGEDGCGSRKVAVFPNLYDGSWSWPLPEG